MGPVLEAEKPNSAESRVYQLNRKASTEDERGLPKQPVDEARLTKTGMEGDFNRYRHEEKRDDPDMAILVLPLETLETLNREGWPVRPGDLGENITCVGIPESGLQPGRRFRVGDAVIEVAKPCTPCDNLYLLPYVGVARGPEFLRVMLDRRGWFARVLVEGVVRKGDRILPVPD